MDERTPYEVPTLTVLGEVPTLTNGLPSGATPDSLSVNHASISGGAVGSPHGFHGP